MQVLFAVWLLLAWMKDVPWMGGVERDSAMPSSATEVSASEGPLSPPPKP